MPVKKDTGSETRKYNYKTAECIGHYGYGNGRARNDFCGDQCPVSRQCWKQTVAKGVTRYFPPSDVLAFNSLIEKWMRKYPKQPNRARRLALKEIIRQGKYDPYLQIVIMNTRRGFNDQPGPVREFKGGLWFYHGAMVAYYA